MSAYDAAVVGLGAMGSAALHHLARAGLRVVGIERFESPHTFGSSHGGSRIIREAYFEDPRYVPLVQRAYEAWTKLERDSGRTLMLTTGGVMIGPRQGELVTGALNSAHAHGLAHELIEAAEVHRRFPAFHPSPEMVGVWEPRAGVLFPEQCITAHLEGAARGGAEIRTNESMTAWRVASGKVELETQAGKIEAARLVLTCGAWLPRHVSELEIPFQVERVVQAWFEPSGNHEALSRAPITIWEYRAGRYFYAFPMLSGAVKAALHHQGSIVDPDHVRREVEKPEIERIREPMLRHMPDAAGALRDAKVCLYTNTPDGHFVVDRHPRHPEVLVVSACSGHGFKFSSALGALIAVQVRGEPVEAELELFRMSRLALGAPPPRAAPAAD